MRKILLVTLLLAGAQTVLADDVVQLKEGHPERYTVVKGDTLWGISGKFLTEPWKWPEVWELNPQIKNPHLIYPGDEIALVYIDGKPQLQLSRSGSGVSSRGTVKLSPTVRRIPEVQAIQTIPLETINSFLLSNRIVDSSEQFEKRPYVVAGQEKHVVSGAGDRIHVLGRLEQDVPTFGIFRPGKRYVDPQTQEVLGINAESIGSGQVIAEEGNVATLTVTRSNQEVRIGDRLLPSEERAINSTFTPSTPAGEISGLILDVPRGVTQIGAMDVVTLNKGVRDGLAPGNVLAVYKTGETVHDRISGQSVKTPDERAGLLMVFRTYDKLSYGLVLSTNQPLSVLDKVRNP